MIIIIITPPARRATPKELRELRQYIIYIYYTIL